MSRSIEKAQITLVIADDHLILRQGLVALFAQESGIRVVGEAASGEELLAQVRLHQPEVVLTDIKMPGMDGVEATRQLVQEFPMIKVIALSMHEEDTLLVELLDAGAKGFLPKNAGKDEVFKAIRAVEGGEIYYSQIASRKLIQLMAESRFNPYGKQQKPTFNEMEVRIIKYLCQELTSKEIAAHLELKTRQVESYRERIQKKMGVRNVAGVILYAVRHGICSVD